MEEGQSPSNKGGLLMKCITISGKAGHGKDTFAKNLKKDLEAQGLRVFIFHYADYIKMLAKEIYGWNGEKDEKGRSILQNLGDKLRSKNKRIIIDELIKILKLVEDDFDIAIIPDARLPLEIEVLKEIWHTISIHVNRINYVNILTSEQKKHLTETALDNYKYDLSYDIEEGDFRSHYLDVMKLLRD